MQLGIHAIDQLLNFILNHKSISLDDSSLFNRDVLIVLSEISNNKRKNDFTLTKKQEKELIRVFLEEEDSFDSHTFPLFCSNIKCINKVLEKDVNNADYIVWKDFTESQEKALVKKIIDLDYVLTQNSSYYLKRNKDVVFNSIKLDIDSFRYAYDDTKYDFDIIKYLIEQNYPFSSFDIRHFPLESCEDKEILKYLFQQSGILSIANSDYIEAIEDLEDSSVDLYVDRMSSFFSDAIKRKPKISDFDALFEYYAELYWKENRGSIVEDNPFGIICAVLKRNEDYDTALSHIRFLPDMKDRLKSKYHLLDEAMRYYHRIVHSNQKIEKADDARNQIAKLSALYIAICKESYKNKEKEELESHIIDLFIGDIDNPQVHKRIMINKAKTKMLSLFSKWDDGYNKEFDELIKGIIKDYSNDLDETTLYGIIRKFIMFDYSKLGQIIEAPEGYSDYKRYKEASKLINRLNSNFIKYNGPELTNYLDIIKYDDVSKKYSYDGPIFSRSQIYSFNKYSNIEKIFEKIKQRILFKGMELVKDEKITKEEIYAVEDELPFTDEFYKFNKTNLTRYTFDDFMHACIDKNNLFDPMSMNDDESYEAAHKFIIDNGMIWIALLDYISNENVSTNDMLLDIINSMPAMLDVAETFGYDVYDLSNLNKIRTLCECSYVSTIAILGTELVEKICDNASSEDVSEDLEVAEELICQMAKRNKSTVPYIKGSTPSYNYSLYDPLDVTLLLCGYDTDACFRVGGIDNDFLHYCALDKNGFVIKITDKSGKFVARAAGFRNGNCIFINQLRTIYDDGGTGYCGNYNEERDEIIEAFTHACLDILKTSDEDDKIDFVFATRSYALGNVKSNVPKNIERLIGKYPMNTDSTDWLDFVTNTPYLNNSSPTKGFTTDYGNYSLICVAYNKDLDFKNESDIKLEDVEAKYTRERNGISIAYGFSEKDINKINRISSIHTHFYQPNSAPAELPDDALVIIGDNWFIIYDNDSIIWECVLDFDEDAVREFKIFKSILEEYKKSDENDIVKILKKHRDLQ